MALGINIKKLEPVSSLLSNPILPPCNSIYSLHNTKPKPTPFSLSVPIEGSDLMVKIFCCCASGIPVPVSVIVILQLSATI